MKIFFIISVILFSFKTMSKEIVYTCLEWNLDLTEYQQDFLYTEKRGIPYFAIEEENTLIIFDDRDNMQLLKLIGNYDETTKIYSSRMTYFLLDIIKKKIQVMTVVNLKLKNFLTIQSLHILHNVFKFAIK